MSEVIELNNHRLLNGDATNRDDVNRLIGDCKVNLLLTDPPYGIDIVKIGGGQLEAKNRQPSINRERANGNNMWLQTQTIKTIQEEQWEHQQDQASKTSEGGGQKVYGKVGKPRHCSTKTLQTSNR